jgi:hypothetical protein
LDTAALELCDLRFQKFIRDKQCLYGRPCVTAGGDSLAGGRVNAVRVGSGDWMADIAGIMFSLFFQNINPL